MLPWERGQGSSRQLLANLFNVNTPSIYLWLLINSCIITKSLIPADHAALDQLVFKRFPVGRIQSPHLQPAQAQGFN